MTLLLIILLLIVLFGGGSYAGYRSGYMGEGPAGPSIIGLLFVVAIVWLIFGSPYHL